MDSGAEPRSGGGGFSSPSAEPSFQKPGRTSGRPKGGQSERGRRGCLPSPPPAAPVAPSQVLQALQRFWWFKVSASRPGCSKGKHDSPSPSRTPSVKSVPSLSLSTFEISRRCPDGMASGAKPPSPRGSGCPSAGQPRTARISFTRLPRRPVNLQGRRRSIQTLREPLPSAGSCTRGKPLTL
nr:uncharacterized protein LOC105730998 [Aotus nancymaae]